MSRFPQRSQSEEEELQAENTQFLCRLQSSLTNASLVGLSLSGHITSSETLNFLPLHQVLICGTYVLLRLRQYWEELHRELANEGPYRASIGGMRIQQPELQVKNPGKQEMRQQGLRKGCEEVKGVSHSQGLPYMPVIIRTELISRHYNDSLASDFGIEKTRELVA